MELWLHSDRVGVPVSAIGFNWNEVTTVIGRAIEKWITAHHVHPAIALDCHIELVMPDVDQTTYEVIITQKLCTTNLCEMSIEILEDFFMPFTIFEASWKFGRNDAPGVLRSQLKLAGHLAGDFIKSREVTN